MSKQFPPWQEIPGVRDPRATYGLVLGGPNLIPGTVEGGLEVINRYYT